MFMGKYKKLAYHKGLSGLEINILDFKMCVYGE